MIDFDRRFGTVVTSSAVMSSGNRYMLTYRDDIMDHRIEAWHYVVLSEAFGFEPVETAYVTFGPGHAWTVVE